VLPSYHSCVPFAATLHRKHHPAHHTTCIHNKRFGCDVACCVAPLRRSTANIVCMTRPSSVTNTKHHCVTTPGLCKKAHHPLSSLPMPGTGKHLDHPVASTCPLCVNACDGSTTIPIRSQRSLAYERSCTSLRNTQLLPAAHASHFPATNATTCPALLWHGWHCDGWCLQGMQHPGLEARQPAPAATVDPVLRTAPCCCHLGDTLPHVPHCLC
jgi:hypothetical protein